MTTGQSLRIAVDIGGTFTDICILDDDLKFLAQSLQTQALESRIHKRTRPFHRHNTTKQRPLHLNSLYPQYPSHSRKDAVFIIRHCGCGTRYCQALSAASC